MDKIHPLDISNRDLTLPLSFPNPFTETPHPLAQLAVKLCLKFLENSNNWSNYPEYQNLKEHKRIGKMFGVLVVQNKNKELGFIAAFSGKLLGQNNYDYFVPPIYNMLEKDGHYNKEEANLFALNHRISIKQQQLDEFRLESESYQKRLQIEKKIIHLKKATKRNFQDKTKIMNEIQYLEKDKKSMSLPTKISVLEKEIQDLKKHRQNKSKDLQQWLFQQYYFVNQHGISKDLATIFKNNTIPSGSGECAAPKLLQFAYLNELKPVALAEFWWGRSTNSKDKTQGEFYPPCNEKCRFILEHMLS